MKHFSFNRQPLGCLLLVLLLACFSSYAQAPAWQSAILGSNYSTETITAGAGEDIYLAGQFVGLVSFGSTTLDSRSGNTFVAKWNNSTSSFTWATQASLGTVDSSIKLTTDGASVYLAGRFNGTAKFGNVLITSVGGFGVYVAKLLDLGSSSSFAWAQRSTGSGYTNVAGVATTGGSIYVIGSFNYTISFGSNNFASPRSYSLFIARLVDAGTSGSFTWACQGPEGSTAGGIVKSGANLYVAGTFSTTFMLSNILLPYSDGNNMFVAKLTEVAGSSQFDWAQTTGGSGQYGLNIAAMAANGPNVYVVGEYGYPIVVGNSTLTGSGQFIAKLTDTGTTGNFSWATQFKSHNYLPSPGPYSTVLAIATNGPNVYVTGAFNDANFGSIALKAVGLDDIFVAKVTDTGPAGNFAWVQRAGGTGLDYAKAVAVTSSGVVYVNCTVSLPATFSSITLAPTAGYFESVLASLQDNISLGSKQPGNSAAIEVFPNPAHASVTIRLPASSIGTPMQLTLSDALGRVVCTRTLAPTGLQTEVSLATLLPGIYSLRVGQDGARQQVRRLAVE